VLYELLRDLIEKCEVGLLIGGWHLSGKGALGVVALVIIFRLLLRRRVF